MGKHLKGASKRRQPDWWQETADKRNERRLLLFEDPLIGNNPLHKNQLGANN